MKTLLDEGLITLAQAAKLLPRRRQGKRVHATSLWRWCRHGISKGGEKIFLEAVVTPSGISTSAEAVSRFLVQLTELSLAKKCPAAPKSPAAVNSQLDRLGL